MSSCFVSDQKPLVFSSGGSRSDSAGRLHGTGFSRRSTANASSRSSGGFAQNDRADRSMSLWVVATAVLIGVLSAVPRGVPWLTTR